MTRRWIFALPFGGIVVALWVMLVAGSDGQIPTQATSACIGAFNLMALAFSVAAAVGPHAERRSRRAWLLLTVVIVMLAACGITFSVGFSDGTLSRHEALLGYSIRMATVPVLMAGVFAFPRTVLTYRQRLRLGLDLTLVVIGGLMLMWYFTIGPAFDRDVTGESWVSVLYPLCDLVLIFGVGTVLMRGAASARRPLVLLLGGLCCYLLLDIRATQEMLQADSNTQLGMSGAYLVVGAVFLVAASAASGAASAWIPPAAIGRTARFGWPAWLGLSRSLSSSGQPVTMLPYLALAVGYLVLVLAQLANGFDQADTLVVGAIALTGTVALRQVLAMRENHLLVVTDSLTGLANRRLLRDHLDRAIEHSRRAGSPVAVLLIDLDGFKEINDELGHEAGDAVLVHFASILGRQVRSSDTAARLGGDEFAVVAPGVTVEDAGGLAQRMLDAAAVPVEVSGRMLPIRASIGVAVSPPSGAEARELLHRADLAMYDAKRRQTHTWKLYIDGDAERRTAGPVPQVA